MFGILHYTMSVLKYSVRQQETKTFELTVEMLTRHKNKRRKGCAGSKSRHHKIEIDVHHRVIRSFIVFEKFICYGSFDYAGAHSSAEIHRTS